MSPAAPARTSRDWGVGHVAALSNRIHTREPAVNWDDTTSPEALKHALEEGRVDEAQGLIGALLEDLEKSKRCVPQAVARDVLRALRAGVRFEALERIAAALENGGQDEPEVRRQLAQARIERPGGATQAIAGLLSLEQDIEERLAAGGLDSASQATLVTERGEVVGLLGRAYKQLYVDAGPNLAEPRTHDWERSLAYYTQAYEAKWGDYLWHGINVVALTTHAERVRRGKPGAYPARKQAEAILVLLMEAEEQGPLPTWYLANRAEALVACGRYPEAIQAIQAYLDAPGLEAFNIYSSRRQLEQLYGLDQDTPPGATILPMMTARMAELGGQDRRVPAVDVSRPVCGASGRDADRGHGDRIPVRRCDDLREVRWPAPAADERPRLLARREGASPLPLASRAHLAQGHVPCRARGRRASQRRREGSALQFAAGRLGCDPGRTRRAADGPPAVDGEDARVNVIGHPKGLDVRISMQDNKVVAHEDPFLRYRTPTDPGSSGSPVFNQAWELVALHHAGAAGANEGILLDALLDAMRKALA